MSQINRLHQIYELQYILLEETTCNNRKLAHCLGFSGKLEKFDQYYVLALG